MGGEPSAGLPQASGVELSYSPCSAPLLTLLAFMKLGHPIPGSDLTELACGGVTQNTLETTGTMFGYYSEHKPIVGAPTSTG